MLRDRTIDLARAAVRRANPPRGGDAKPGASRMEAAQPPAQSSTPSLICDMEVAPSMPYSAPNIVFRMRCMIGIALLAIAAWRRRAYRLARRPPGGRRPVAVAERCRRSTPRWPTWPLARRTSASR